MHLVPCTTYYLVKTAMLYVCMYVCVGVCGQETQEGPDVHVQEVDGETEKAQVGLSQAKPCVLCWWMANGGGSIVVIVIVRHRSTISSVVASC